MLLWLVLRHYTERFNYAYAAFHGRLDKTIGELPSINCYFYDWTALREEYFLCFACTFRDVNTKDGILTWEKWAMNYGINK